MTDMTTDPSVRGFSQWRQGVVHRYRREIQEGTGQTPGSGGGGVLGFLEQFKARVNGMATKVAGTPLWLTHGRIREEAGRIHDAIDSLDNDVRAQFSWISPAELDPKGGEGDGSGYESGMSDSEEKVTLKKGAGKLLAVVMRKRDAGKTAGRLSTERAFGARWLAFLKRWGDWSKATLGQSTSLLREGLIILGARPVGGGEPIAISPATAWEQLDGLTKEYQGLYKQFVHDGGTPDKPMAQTPSERQDSPPDPLVPKWVWWTVGGIAGATALGYLLANVGYVMSSFKGAPATARGAAYHGRMLASYRGQP